MTQANVGPNMLPGNGRSETPPDHRSTSFGCLKLPKLFIQRSIQFKENLLEYGAVFANGVVGHGAHQIFKTVGVR